MVQLKKVPIQGIVISRTYSVILHYSIFSIYTNN